MSSPPAISPSRTPWQQLRSRKRFWLVVGWLGSIALLALLAGVLANDAPLTTRYRGQRYFPAFQPAQMDSFAVGPRFRWQRFDQADWKSQELASTIWPPVPHGLRLLSAPKNQPPGSLGKAHRHWLGTTPNGKDLLASLIHGSRISLFVGLLAASLAILLGSLIGAAAGYWGDDRLEISLGGTMGGLLGMVPAWFYAWNRRGLVLEMAAQEGLATYVLAWLLSALLFMGLLGICFWAGRSLLRSWQRDRRLALPLDTLLFRLAEWLSTLPRLLLVLSITAMFRQPSIWVLMGIIGLVSWPGLALMVRGQILSIRQRSFIQAAKALGIKDRQILWRHILPNSLPPILIVFSSAIGGAIALESALSFLGLAEGNSSWGSLLSIARNQIDSWWLVLFPGGAIFLTVLCFHVLAELIRDAWDPSLQSPPRLGA
jgi:peptide/nickel transport system permease protein